MQPGKKNKVNIVFQPQNQSFESVNILVRIRIQVRINLHLDPDPESKKINRKMFPKRLQNKETTTKLIIFLKNPYFCSSNLGFSTGHISVFLYLLESGSRRFP